MDSATQFVLGACVGAAVLGPKIGPRKAVILGGLMGTVPDLDVFYPYETAVDSFVLHRGPTHSLVIHALAAPIFGEIALRVLRAFGDVQERVDRLRVYLAVFLCFATHALLDAMTIYGTKLFWPLSPEPFGLGSVFIIDPLYTIPLVVLTLWGLFQGRWGARYRKGIAVALVASTAYLGWTAGAQQMALARAEEAVGGFQDSDRVLSIPTPLNSLFWKVILLRDDSYANIYVPLLGDKAEITAYAHDRNTQSIGCATELDELRRVAWFSRDIVRFERVGDVLRIADLRMGLTPGYVFRFEVGRFDVDGLVPIPVRQIEEERAVEGELAWLQSGMMGEGVPRASESGAEVALPLPDVLTARSEAIC